MMAAANMVIEPASAPPETRTIKSSPSVVADNLGVVEAAETMSDEIRPRPNVKCRRKRKFCRCNS